MYAMEPLLSWDIVQKIIQYPFYHMILTNGLLLKGDIAKTLLNYNNVSLLISLDGIQKNHEYYRGKTFDTIITNILNYNSYSDLAVSMTVNINSLPTLFQSLELLYSLPIGNFECHLNLYDDWTDELFYEYICILKEFILKYKNKKALPKYSLENRFSNYGVSKEYKKDRGGPLHGIDINSNMIIQKPNRSCLVYPQQDFFGIPFATAKGFISYDLYKQYVNFMEQEYNNYNYYSEFCDICKYKDRCSEQREHVIYLQRKECYPILESFILEEEFWNNNTIL